MFPARLLRLSGTNEGYLHLPQGVGHTHLRDGCLAILLSGRGDQMNKPYFNVFWCKNTLKYDHEDRSCKQFQQHQLQLPVNLINAYSP